MVIGNSYLYRLIEIRFFHTILYFTESTSSRTNFLQIETKNATPRELVASPQTMFVLNFVKLYVELFLNLKLTLY